jgi:hypothetical protein
MTITINGTGPVTGSDRAASGANPDITSLSSLASINGGQLAGFRNRIINGAFNVQQYGSPYFVSNAGSNQAAYSIDHWFYQITSGASGSGTSTSTTTLQPFTLGQTAVPGEPQYFLRHQVTAVGTPSGATQAIRVQQSIEGVRTFAGQQVTLSFYAKADASRTFAAVLGQGFGTGGSPSATTGTGQTFAVTTAWQKFSITLTVPSIAGKTIGTASDVLSVSFFLYKNDNLIYNDTLGAVGSFVSGQYLDLALVQLELGSVATPFEQRPYGLELALCQRYYYPIYATVGIVGNTLATWRNTCVFPVAMRTMPTLTLVGALTMQTGITSTTFSAIVNNYSTPLNAQFDASNTVTAAATGQVAVLIGGGSSNYIAASAEL